MKHFKHHNDFIHSPKNNMNSGQFYQSHQSVWKKTDFSKNHYTIEPMSGKLCQRPVWSEDSVKLTYVADLLWKKWLLRKHHSNVKRFL